MQRSVARCFVSFLCSVGSGDTVLSPRRMYTVSLPPEGHVAVTPDTTGMSVPEPSDSTGDSTGKSACLLL